MQSASMRIAPIIPIRSLPVGEVDSFVKTVLEFAMVVKVPLIIALFVPMISICSLRLILVSLSVLSDITLIKISIYVNVHL